jgi:cytosine/adenosine deaminase-related metal-dependent hydrolase
LCFARFRYNSSCVVQLELRPRSLIAMSDFRSSNTQSAYSARAGWLIPNYGPPRRDGTLTVRAGRVESIDARDAIEPVIDLGDVAILPGLVNAHTHLEFSDLSAPLGEPGMRMPEWIRRVIQCRRERSPDVASAIAAGLRESAAGGVTTIGEIATGAWQLPDDKTGFHVTAFHETIGLSEERFADSIAAATAFLDHAGADPRVTPGLSPHAPYTVHPKLCESLIALASARNAPVAMHLAESPEELELLRDGRGALVEFLNELGFWRDDVIARGTRPLDYLRMLAHAPRALVIHGNYLDDTELDFLAQHAANMALVYCARTHAYFGHRAYHNLNELLRRGVRVCLGTDSRASNPDLSLWRELQFVAQRNRDLDGAALLSLATTSPAQALGVDHERGDLVPGKSADFCVVHLPSSDARDPYNLLWQEDARVVATMARGKVSFRAPGFANFAT